MKKDVLEKIENECVSLYRILSLLCMSARNVEEGRGDAVEFAAAAWEILPDVQDRIDQIRDLASGDAERKAA